MKHPFRIKHKATGLYYCPVRRIKVTHKDCTTYIESNLSKKGKVYFTDPRKHIKYVEDHTRPDYTHMQKPWFRATRINNPSPDDFEIEPIKFD